MSVAISLIDNPMQLSSNFVLSCEANDITGVSAGSDLTTWLSNAVSNHLVSPANLPSYEIDAQGFPCVKFDFTNNEQYMSSVLYAQPSEITYCIALSHITLNLGNGWIISRWGTGAREEVRSQSSGGFLVGQSTPSSSSYFTPSGLVTVNNKYVLTYRRSTTGLISVFINFKLVLQVQNSFFDYDATTKYYGVSSSGSGSVMDGYVYQVHVCHEALNDEKLKKLIRYAAFKSGTKI